MILIPVKDFRNAKQRLAPVLSPAERSKLAKAMFEDVLQALKGWTNRPPVAVVTSDSYARRLVKNLRFEAIEDRVNAGETEAIAMATRICEKRGVPRTLVIPGDIPLLEASELQSVIEAAPDSPDGGSVLVPATDERGTNAALRTPPGLFPLRFGDYSFEPHLRAARATGKPCVVLRLPSIELDVDTPADLALLIASESRTRTQELLSKWSIRERLEHVGRKSITGE